MKRVAAIAAVLVLTVAGAWFYLRGTPAEPAGPGEPTVASARLELDLRPYSVSRSPEELATQPPLVLPRERLTLAMLLPVGSAPGSYDVQFRDARGTVATLATGQAEIRDFVTTLDAAVDLRALARGEYELAVRRAGEGWRTFPVAVR
jgi:hypothetical protein